MSALGRITRGSQITYYSLLFFIAYAFKGQVHVLIYRTSENCKSLVLQDKCNIELFLYPDTNIFLFGVIHLSFQSVYFILEPVRISIFIHFLRLIKKEPEIDLPKLT